MRGIERGLYLGIDITHITGCNLQLQLSQLSNMFEGLLSDCSFSVLVSRWFYFVEICAHECYINKNSMIF